MFLKLTTQNKTNLVTTKDVLLPSSTSLLFQNKLNGSECK